MDNSSFVSKNIFFFEKSNQTNCFSFQRRLNVDCSLISPDLHFVLLYQCASNDQNGTKYYTYEIFSTNSYPLTIAGDEIELQKVLWSPSYDYQQKALPNRNKIKSIEKNKIQQAIAFIHNYDIYYKPRVHSDLVIRITSTGE